MTGVDVDALAKLREALCRVPRVWVGDFGPAEIADALLPVVDQIATDRAATALEAAAGELIRLSAGSGYNVWYASWLRDRAAALRADAVDPS